MTYNKKSVEDIDVKGKRVLVRCDFNVPVKDGVITDAKRIDGALPTIKYLMEHGAKIILCSHMGRPHNVLDEKVSLNKKEKAKIEALPEAEQAAAKEAALEKAKKDRTNLSLKIIAEALNERGRTRSSRSRCSRRQDSRNGDEPQGKAKFSFSKMFVSTQQKRRTTPHSPKSSLPWLKSM